MNKGVLNSPVGILEIGEDNNAIIYIKFCGEDHTIDEDESEYLTKCKEQLKEYFDGTRKSFDLKLSPEGTDFQKDVWKQLLRIPYGETKSYQYIADKVGDPGASRAVGNANNKNPIAIVVPCHRVVGANGKLTGYAGGLDKKDWLLKHEMKHTNSEMQMDLF